MSETKHLPGPWVAESNPGRTPVTWQVVKYFPAPGRPTRLCVADLPAAITTAGANARLVAAAPDLLSCLQRMTKAYNGLHAAYLGKAGYAYNYGDDPLRDSLAAIAKVEGHE